MKHKLIFLLVLALQFSLLLVYGPDLTNHLHYSFLYSKIIYEGQFSFFDPYVGDGKQPTLIYGIPTYLISGLAYPALSRYTVDFIELLILIASILLLWKWFKDEKILILLLLPNLHVTDPFVFIASCFLFWLTSYGYFKKKKWWSAAAVLAMLNHPYNLVFSLYFVLKNKKLIVPLVFISLFYFYILSNSSNSDGSPLYWNTELALMRAFISFAPILFGVYYGKIKEKKAKFVRKIPCFPIISTLFLSGFLLGMGQATYEFTLTPEHKIQFTDDFISGIPKELEARLRVVDHYHLPFVYHVPKTKFKMIEGSFRENNYNNLKPKAWETREEYEEFLKKQGAEYVLYCKLCNPRTNEHEFTRKYPLIWENKYYRLYNTSF